MRKRKRLKTWLGMFLLLGVVFLIAFHGSNSRVSRSKGEVIIAIIDSGLDIDSIPSDRVYGDGYNIFNKVELMKDDFGHGTSVASLIVNNTNDNVKIMPVRVTDNEGNSTIDLVYEGILCAVENGADVINLSMNTYFYSENNKLEKLINDLADKGIPVVVSAGNSGDDVKYLAPANMESAIVVGALNKDGEVYHFSNYGDTVDYYAYGKYDGQMGTSFASAYVTSMLADRMQVYGCGYEDALEKIPMKMWSDSHVSMRGLNVGDDKSDGTLYIGGVTKTQNNIGVGLLDLDWKNMDAEELNSYIVENGYRYVGLLLSKLTEQDRSELMEKADILSNPVRVGYMEYSEEKEAYVEVSYEEVPYFEYALECYEEEKDVMHVSDWIARNKEATFYISSPNRKLIAQYVITGFQNKYCIDASYNPPGMVMGGFKCTSTMAKGYKKVKEDGKDKKVWDYSLLPEDSKFKMPKVDTMTKYLRTARSTIVRFYSDKAKTKLVKETFNNTFLPAGSEDASIAYGISIHFTDYENHTDGYHDDPKGVKAYNAGAGLGTTTKEATCTQIGSDPEPQLDKANFKELKHAVKMVASLNTILNSNANINNFTIDDVKNYTEKTFDNAYYIGSESTLKEGCTEFTLNANPYFAFGLEWYADGNGTLRTKSDVPEYVLGQVANTYTVKYNKNKPSTASNDVKGTTANSTHTYDKSKKLTANGYTLKGWTFVGWNTKADGSGKSYADKASVKNLTSTNNGTFTLYAQWKENVATIRYHVNGGAVGDTTGVYTAKSSIVHKNNAVCTTTFKYGSSSLDLYHPTSSFGLTKKGYNVKGSTAWRVNSADSDFILTQSEITRTTNKEIIDKIDALIANGNATITMYANWQENKNTEVAYKVKHYVENSSNGWTLHSTDNNVGVPNSNITPSSFKETIDGFIYSHAEVGGVEVESVRIPEDGSLEINLYYKIGSYTIHFDANGGEGYMADTTAYYGKPFTLPYNAFAKGNAYGMSQFLGWGILADTREILYSDGAEITLNEELESSVLTLYAIWDDCPWIIANDLYYSLSEAQSGVITYDELMSHATAFDSEYGANIPEGVDSVMGTSFTLIDYSPTDFTFFTSDGSVTETYQVIDSAGNTYKQMITVYIVDTEAKIIKPEGTTRFINEKYYYESYENGGLEENSVWKTDPEYISLIEDAFENSRNNTPIMSFYFEYEDIRKMKEKAGN